MAKKVTVSDLWAKKHKEPIACLTAYDYTSAKILDNAGIDLILVGDSLGMVMQGHKNTLSVTLDEMIYHSKMVRRGVERAFLAVDMPFGTYATLDDGIHNAIRVVRETGADAVKIEGADAVVQEMCRRLYHVGVNVMGHIGLQPQQVNVMGGFRVQGYDSANADRLMKEAADLDAAGIKLAVLEGMEESCAQNITAAVKFPTIGIGAGVHCDGQVLVYQDVFGLYTDMVPKFVKKYANAGDLILKGAEAYIKEVKSSVFPSEEHTFKSKK